MYPRKGLEDLAVRPPGRKSTHPQYVAKVVDELAAAANLIARDLSGNGQNRHTTSVTVVQAVEQMHVGGPATSGTDCKFNRDVRFRPGGKRGRFFVSRANPFDVFALADFLEHPVE